MCTPFPTPKAIHTKLSLLSPPASEFLILSDTKIRVQSSTVYALSAINCAVLAERKLVSVSGNRCLVPWSVIPVDASDSFGKLRVGKYEKCDSYRNHKKNSHHKFDNAITIMNNE